MHKAKGCSERFELLAWSNVFIGPGRSESASRIKVEVRKVRKTVECREFFQLAKQQAVFVPHRLAEVSKLYIHQKFAACLFDCEELRLFDLLSLSFPAAH